MTQQSTGIRGALGHRDCRLLLGAFVFSRSGDYIFSVALLVYVLERTGSATWVAALLILRLIPVLVVGPFAGVLSDRVARRRLMVTTDLLRLLLMLSLLVVVQTDGPVWLVVAVTVVAGVVGTPYMPSYVASLPRVVTERELAGANAAVSVVDYLASIVGPAVGAVIAATAGLAVALTVNAATFVASAVLLLFVRSSLDAPKSEDADDADDGGESMVAELTAGAAAVWADPVLRVLVTAVVMATFVFGFEIVYLVFVSQDLLGTGASGVGYLDAAVGVGGVVGALLVSRLAESTHVRRTLIVISVLSSLPMALLALVSQAWMAYALLFAEGAASVALDVVGVTAMQRSVPADRLARADAVISSAAVAATLLGSLLAPWLLGLVGLRWALALAAVLPTTVVVVALLRLEDVDQDAREQSAATNDVVELIERTPALADLLAPVREVLAAAASERTLAPGEVLLRQGDEAEAVWLLASGTCDVLQDGPDGPASVRLTQLTAPDLVGEIGVVDRRRRTATVVATTACTLQEVSATAFREALSVGDPELPVLRGQMNTRLARSLTG